MHISKLSPSDSAVLEWHIWVSTLIALLLSHSRCFRWSGALCWSVCMSGEGHSAVCCSGCHGYRYHHHSHQRDSQEKRPPHTPIIYQFIQGGKVISSPPLAVFQMLCVRLMELKCHVMFLFILQRQENAFNIWQGCLWMFLWHGDKDWHQNQVLVLTFSLNQHNRNYVGSPNNWAQILYCCSCRPTDCKTGNFGIM